ncbi:MAG: outer membrane protein assembly factor BamB family protein [Thermoguttaceae bacterium]
MPCPRPARILPLIAGLLCSTCAAWARAGEPSSSWPLFRGDSLATGVAAAELPDRPDVLWTFKTEKGGFESTAAIVGDRVFAASTDGNLYALELGSGKKLWAFTTELGFSASPSVHGGLVYVGDVDGRFHCVGADDGRERWHFDSEAEINSSANFYRDKVLFGSQDGILYCLDGASGQLAWKFESQDQIRCFPTIVENRAFVAGCDGSLHVVDLDEGKEIGSVAIDSPTGSTPAVLGDLLFVGTEGSTFFAIDWNKPAVVWHYTAEQRQMPFRSSAAVTEKVVLVGSLDKNVHALDPRSGKPLWIFSTRGKIEGSPVIVGKRAFIGSGDGRLYALEIETGREVWQYETGGSLLGSPAIVQGRLVIGTDDGTLYCFGKKP